MILVCTLVCVCNCYFEHFQGSNCGLVMNAIQTAQRTILPATCTCLSTPGHYQPDISANGTVSSTPIPFIHPPLKASQLLPGATILAPTSNLHQIQGFALVPAQYLPQVPFLSTYSFSFWWLSNGGIVLWCLHDFLSAVEKDA